MRISSYSCTLLSTAGYLSYCLACQRGLISCPSHRSPSKYKTVYLHIQLVQARNVLVFHPLKNLHRVSKLFVGKLNLFLDSLELFFRVISISFEVRPLFNAFQSQLKLGNLLESQWVVLILCLFTFYFFDFEVLLKEVNRTLWAIEPLLFSFA